MFLADLYKKNNLNENISPIDLAEMLFNAITKKYPETVSRYGHEVISNAVLDYAEDAEDLQSVNDIDIAVQEIIDDLANYQGDRTNELEPARPNQISENLRKWFKEKWVRFGPDGKIRGACARGDSSEGKPKCLPQSKAHSLGKKARAQAAARKRRQDPNPERSGPAINVATKKKSNEGVAESAPAVTFAGKDPNQFTSPNGGRPVMVVVTDQGSRYLITSDGMVLRHKSVHANTGGEDAGLQAWSEHIEFYDRSKPLVPGMMQGLAFPDAVTYLFDKGRVALSKGQNGERVALILDNGKWRAATIADAMPKAAASKPEWGKIVIKADAGTWGVQPKLGWQPLDYNQRSDGTLNRVHNGSPVSHGAKVQQGVAEGKLNEVAPLAAAAMTAGRALAPLAARFLPKATTTTARTEPTLGPAANVVRSARTGEPLSMPSAARSAAERIKPPEPTKIGLPASAAAATAVTAGAASIPAFKSGTPSTPTTTTAQTIQPTAQPSATNFAATAEPQSFNQAFAAARKAAAASGDPSTGRFTWKGQEYQTNLAGDSAKKPEQYATRAQQRDVGDFSKNQSVNETIPKKFNSVSHGAKVQRGVSETSDYSRRREREEAIISGQKPARKKGAAQTSDYAKRREKEKKTDQGVAEGGPFSYGKPPRKGSVADLAAKKRREQERSKRPIEPKDQMVGVAKVIKGVSEAVQQCPECGGPAFSNLVLAEKKDACYNKVRSRYKVWPSAYASGALVQCRKRGAANWGKKKTNETRFYFSPKATDSSVLVNEFKLQQDSDGWYIAESQGPAAVLEAQRAFGIPKIKEVKLKEFDLAAFSGSAAIKGDDNVLSPIGSIPNRGRKHA